MSFSNRVEDEGGGLILKLTAGVAIEGVLLGEVKEFYGYFVDEGGKRKFVLGEKGDGLSKFRFKTNFAVKTPVGYAAKILEQGKSIYNQLFDLFGPEDKGGAGYPKEKTLVKITRTGSGQFDTEYKVVPLPRQLNEQDLAELGTLQLNNLDK